MRMNQKNSENNIIVCVSGGGRSLDNLLDQQEQFGYKVSGVISSKETCKAVEIANRFDLDVLLEKTEIGSIDVITQTLSYH